MLHSRTVQSINKPVTKNQKAKQGLSDSLFGVESDHIRSWGKVNDEKAKAEGIAEVFKVYSKKSLGFCGGDIGPDVRMRRGLGGRS